MGFKHFSVEVNGSTEGLMLLRLVAGGASKDLDQKTENAVIRFAADSESLERLSREEKKLLDQVVKVLSDN